MLSSDQGALHNALDRFGQHPHALLGAGFSNVWRDSPCPFQRRAQTANVNVCSHPRRQRALTPVPTASFPLALRTKATSQTDRHHHRPPQPLVPSAPDPTRKLWARTGSCSKVRQEAIGRVCAACPDAGSVHRWTRPNKGASHTKHKNISEVVVRWRFAQTSQSLRGRRRCPRRRARRAVSGAGS